MTESMRMGSGGSRIRESEVVFRPSSCTGNRRRRTGGPRRKAICCCSTPHIQVLDISGNNVLGNQISPLFMLLRPGTDCSSSFFYDVIVVYKSFVGLGGVHESFSFSIERHLLNCLFCLIKGVFLFPIAWIRIHFP